MKFTTVTLPRTEAALCDFVKACDADFEARMDRVVESIAARKDLKIVGLTGPTCAGKTTTAKKLTACLQAHGHRVHTVSLDDFYYDKEFLHRRAEEDPDIEIDYDSEETLDCELLAQKVESLWRGEPTDMPRFDFESGLRVDGGRVDPEPGDVFLFEGIQLLYPKVNAILSRYGSYRNIYICPETAIVMGDRKFEPNRIRLLRRVVRDFHRRASSPAFTLYLWESVRANEEKNIFPNAHLCHEFIDSTMPYEIGMLKPHLQRILSEVSKNSPYYAKAQAILKKISGATFVPSEYMTKNSLYKEFI